MDLDEILRIGFRSAIIGASALAIASLVFWALKRRRAARGVRRPGKVWSFVVNRSPEEVAQQLRGAIQRTPYRIEGGTPTDADLLLSEEGTSTSWGFYYPIYLAPLEKYKTRVEIGIASQAFQIGPVVKRHHRHCIETIKTILGGKL